MCREEYMAGLMRLSAVGVEGTALTGAEESRLKRFPPSGVILFERNVEDLDQLGSLIDRIANLITVSSGIPPLIMADHEGGRISVLAGALGIPPSQLAIASVQNQRERLSVYAETAARLKIAGINTVLFPLADVNSEPLNPVIGCRSFGDSRRLVEKLVAEAVSALRGEGLITCIKHFPGHGSADRDSHLGLPVLPLGLDELRRVETLPFKSGIKAGAEMVMTAHVRPAERNMPASLDPEVVDGILRNEIGFEGVIITDALEMKGAVLPPEEDESVPDAVRLASSALVAGTDMLLYSDPVIDVFRRFEEGPGGKTSSGLFSSDEMKKKAKASFSRIDRLRKRGGGAIEEMAGESLCEEEEISGGKEHSRKIRRDKISFLDKPYQLAAEWSVEVIRDPAGLLLLKSRTPSLIRIIGERNDFSGAPAEHFIEELREGAGRAVLEREGAGSGGSDYSGADRTESSSRGLDPIGDFIKPAAGFGKKLFELTLGGNGTGEGVRAMCIICRRPLTGEAVRRITLHAQVVAVCDWPYAADYVPPDKTLIITRGLYPAAAAEINRLLFDRKRGASSRDNDNFN